MFWIWGTLSNRYSMWLRRTRYCRSRYLFFTHASRRVLSFHRAALQSCCTAITSTSVLSLQCVCVCVWEGQGLFCPVSPSTFRYQSKLRQWGSLAFQAPFSTEETKNDAVSLHHIKQSLNVSSCYTLPSETFMKGPLMWFQKHLVIGPWAGWERGVGPWTNGFCFRTLTLCAGIPVVL